MKYFIPLFFVLGLFGQANNEVAVPAWGEIYISSPVATTTTSGSPVKSLGTTTLGDAIQFDMPANNRLRYTGAKTSVFACQVNVSLESDANSLLATIYLSDNGAVDLTSGIDREIATINDHGAMSTGFLVELSQNEYVELWLDSESGNPDLTVDNMILFCMKLN